MKETLSLTILFFIIGLLSGAMTFAALIVFTVISGFLIYAAWLEDKKEKRAKQKLIVMRKERLARRNYK